MRTYPLIEGEPAPWFHVETDVNPAFAFDTLAGRFIFISFFGSSTDPFAQAILEAVKLHQHQFTGTKACFFSVSNDPTDREKNRVLQVEPAIRCFWDFDNAVAKLFGLLIDEHAELRQHTFVLDQRLRCLLALPMDKTPEEHAQTLVEIIGKAPDVPEPTRATIQAPILVVPNIFESGMCQALIDYFDAGQKRDSGFMRDVDGKTVELKDHDFKRREDVEVADEQLRTACMHRIHDRLVPEVAKAFQFHATKMERYMVSCYDGARQSRFSAHRDNTTKGTAHRRFAVSLNLNTGDYEGGYLRFREFGTQAYEAPAGGAVVFSCSLLHEATPVVRGKRYAFLPFLYDEAAARIREQNLQYLGASAET